MERIFDKTKIIFKLHIIIVIAIPIVTIFQLASGGNASSRKSNAAQMQYEDSPLQSAMINFHPSIEMKENVDFLLTPALLVQESISKDVVITYPSE